jgi:Bacterial regulatory proteins, luxR family
VSNEIARELVPGDGSVKTHVARIFSKLELHDRAQAVVLPYGSALFSRSVSVRAHECRLGLQGTGRSRRFPRKDDRPRQPEVVSRLVQKRVLAGA